MRVSRPSRRPRSRGTPRLGLVAAALAALALLVQALIPAAAIAHDAAQGGRQGLGLIAICTGQGMKTVAVAGAVTGGQPDPAAKHFMGLHCTACAFANYAATGDGDLGLAAQPVRYAARAIVFQPERVRAAAQARAPPRPPGQGPPAASIA